MINLSRFAIANKVMDLLFPASKMQLTIRHERICLKWLTFRGETVEKKWECRDRSWYPTIYDKIPTGGTRIIAIAQLVNWIRDKPVLPIQSWEYWCSDKVGMKPPEILEILKNSDYPKEYKCLWCGSNKNLDWYDFGKQSGLGCLHPSPDCLHEIQNEEDYGSVNTPSQDAQNRI